MARGREKHRETTGRGKDKAEQFPRSGHEQHTEETMTEVLGSREGEQKWEEEELGGRDRN